MPGKPLKMNEILKILLFQDPYMPGIDLNLVCVNMEQFLKIDVVQSTANGNHICNITKEMLEVEFTSS